MNLAQIALTQKRFNDAITSACKIAVTQYWREQKEAIIQQAKSKLESDNIKPSYSANTMVVRSQPITPRVTPTIHKRNNSNLNASSRNYQPIIRKRKLKSQPSPTKKVPTIDNCQASASILGQGSNCQSN